MLDKDSNFMDNKEEMATFREAVFSLEGELIVEVSGFKPGRRSRIEINPGLMQGY